MCGELPARAPGRRHLHNAGPAVNQGRRSLQPVRLHSGAGFAAKLSFSGAWQSRSGYLHGGFLKRPLLTAAEPPPGRSAGPERRRAGTESACSDGVGRRPCPAGSRRAFSAPVIAILPPSPPAPGRGRRERGLGLRPGAATVGRDRFTEPAPAGIFIISTRKQPTCIIMLPGMPSG